MEPTMDTSAAGEGCSSFTFRVKQEPGQCESVAPPAAVTEDASGRMIRKVTVLDPLKLKLLSRQNHNMLLSGLNAAKAKAKPPAPTPPSTVPTTVALTATVTATEGEPTNTTAPCMTAEPEPSVAVAEPATRPTAEPPPVSVASKPPTPLAPAKAPGAGGGSNLFRRKKVVPAVIAKKIAQKEKAKSAPQPKATPAKTPITDAALQPARVEDQTPTSENQLELPVVVAKEEPPDEVIRPTTAFRRIKPKVAICLNPSRPKKSILKKNTSSELLKDLIPEETIVLEDDDERDGFEQQKAKKDDEQKRQQHEEEERNKHEKERKAAEEKRRIEQEEEQRKQAEERRRREEEEKRKAEELRRIEEAERKKAEERRWIEEEEKRKADELRRIEEAERKKAEEHRRIEEEEKRKAEELRQIEERQRKQAEEHRRIQEEEKRKNEELRWIEEEEKRKVEEKRRIEDEEKKKAEELQRIQEEAKITAEQQRRMEEEEKQKAKTEAEDRSKVETSRKSRKIPAEVWKRQMEKMRTNPNRLHSAVISSEPPRTPVVLKGSVTVEKSVLVSVQEPVNVEAPVVGQQKPEPVVKSAEQRTIYPAKEIRRICPLPPSVGRQLLNCVAVNAAKPEPPKKSEPGPAAVTGVSQTKAIRRISRLPPNLASVVVSAVKQSMPQQKPPATVPEKAPIEVERTEETVSAERSVISVEQSGPAPSSTKEIKRIARLPPDIANRLLSTVNQKTSTPGTTPPVPVANRVEPLANRMSAVFPQMQQEPSPVQAQQEPNPQKEIRRISQLPRNVAMKLVDSLKQKGIIVPKLALRKETTDVPEEKGTAAPSEPTTPSSTASAPEVKIEPQEPSTKTRQKVEILSQVILPTASYNLEELLAGKSTEGFNSGPSGSMPLPLPMPRARQPTTSVPAPIHALPMVEDPIMKDDVASEVTVTTENDATVDSMHETSDECIIPDPEPPSESIPVQYAPPPKNIPQRQETMNQSVQQTVFSCSQVPTSQQYAVSYGASSSQPIYPQAIQSPGVIQQTASIPSGQPSITYYAKIPNSQPSSQPQPLPYRPRLALISRHAMNPSRIIGQRRVLNPASFQQHPTPDQRPRFAPAQFVLVRHPSPAAGGRTVPQIQHQLQQHQQQQQSRQHLMVPKASYYHRYPADGQNQHQVIYPTPRFMISQQSQIHPHPQQPLERPRSNYVIPTVSDQNKAFRPFEPAQSSSQALPPGKPCVIPKIVIDSSYVEQQDRPPQFAPRTPPSEQPLQNFSPCSEEIKNKLRDKLRARMLQSQSGSPSLNTPPSTPLPQPPPSEVTSQPTVPKLVAVSEHRIPTVPHRTTQVFHPHDFQQPRMQLARVSQPPPKHQVDHRVIKQYICQGRKIYLTKISVTKPSKATAQSTPQEVHQSPSETGFHGFPQAVIKNDQRIFQQFSETVQQLERRISPEPPEDSSENQNLRNVRGRIKTRKPSVVTAVTTGLQGETFIITELIDPPEVAQEVQIMETPPVKLPPRITTRRKTFVVDDSDVELRAERLPWVETTSQEESQGEEKKVTEVKVKVEDEDRVKSAEGRSAFERHVKEEEFSDPDTSQADEDLAREILALVEKERKSLRINPAAAKKVKKRIKRRKRRKKKKNDNEELVDLLMKHVNQESLIADIVATQQKRLPVVEISDTDEDDRGEVQQRLPHVVKKDPDAAAESADSMISDESETDIFAEILKPFVEDDTQEEEKEVAAIAATAEPQEEGSKEEPEKVETVIAATAETQEEEKMETVSAVNAEPQEEASKEEQEIVEIVSAVPAKPQEEEEENVEIVSSATEESQNVQSRPEKQLVETVTAVAEEPSQEDNKCEEQKTETATVVPEEPHTETSPVEQPIEVPKVIIEPEIPEISAEIAIDPNPVIELNQPTTTCDQICDTSSALPVAEPKPKKAPAPRAPKRKLKPTLVSRSKIRKVVPAPPPVEIELQRAPTVDDIEDSSDPFSDRDEPLPAAVEEPEPQDAIKPSSVRELVDEWESDEAPTGDLAQSTIRPFEKHVSFDKNGNVPCRISKNNTLKRTAMLIDPVAEVVAIEVPIKEAVPVTESQSVPEPPSEVKSVRVSVRKTDLVQRRATPEPVAVHMEELATKPESPTRVESPTQSVINLLKDWDESPVKQRSTKPPIAARVPLDGIASEKLSDTKKVDQPVAEQTESLDKSQDVSMERQGSIVLENIALTDQNRWDEPNTSEPERIIARIIYDKNSSTELDTSTSNVAIAQDGPSRQTRSHGKLNVVPTAVESPTTPSSSTKQASITAWLTSKSNETPPQEPVIERQKPVPKAKRSTRDRPAEKADETQKPAGRTLRSRTKSVFAEKAPLAEKEESTKEKVVEASSESHTEVRKEAGEAACAARKGKEQESKECSTSKPVPIVTNRIPIQISSEDEDDAPLAKRRKVLRKRRSMMRTRDRLRDLSANKRLFRGGNAHPGTLIADGSYLGETTFIKTEPLEVADTPECYPAPSESFTVITPEANAERLLSVVTVQNNQIVHAQDYDAETPPRKQYFSKDLVQSTSTPIQAPAPPVEDHVFATPEPVRVPKRKRRTKQELEADRLAKQQKSYEEAVVEQPSPQEPKPRQKRDNKSYVPIDPETVDPAIQEFQCATCSEKIPRDMWDRHYAKHVGLTYRVNVDPVVDLYDETTATAIVARFMKVHRQVTIYCDKCNVAKKSALGLVSHRLICGMTKQEIEASKVTCEHCNRKLMAVSMNCHLAAHCPVLKRKKLEQAIDLEKLKTEAAASSEVDPATLTHRGTVKRKATAKAEQRIQNLSYSELILSVSKAKVTDGCLALWRTQFRKAKTALCVFQTCDFTGNDEMEMRHHHEFCPSPCELFECKNCKYQSEQIEQMAKHIKLRHSAVLACITAGDSSGTDAKMTSESSDDEGTSGVDENDEPFCAANDENEKPKKAKRKSLKSLLKSCNRWGNNTRDQFNEESDVYREMVLDEVIQLRSLKSDFHLTAREWTAEFRIKNYSRKILFSSLRPDLDVRFLTFNMVQEYIPKCAKSLRYMIRSTNLYNAPILAHEYTEKWQHLEVFSGQVNDKESVFYCGGPIVALDWMPVPDGNDEHQILAVACKNDFDEFYLADRIYPTKCLIQIWDVGFLSNSNLYNKKVENSPPALLYSIACDFGPIWSLKFCPSGCYNSKDKGDEYDRLGLLAAAGSDGNVHIFSLGRNYEDLISNSYRVVNLTPVLKLTLSLEGDSSCSQYECHSAVKLSWSKSKNHAMLAAGYSNGAVGVWNLNLTSPLLTGTRDGVRALLPVHKAFIPDSCITAVDLHYTEDTRYLLVCNADRKVVVYDLSTGYLPVEVCSVNARSKVTTACWNTHFPLITMAFDDVYAIDRCALTFHQTREIGLRLHPLYTFTAEATDMSGSDHLSTHVIGTDGGDVLCHQPMAYVHHMGQKNNQLMKYILTSTISVKVNDELTDNSYGMFHKNYGVLFSDSDKNSARMDLRSLQVKSFRRAMLHEYPGIRINQVRWNPNEKSHQYYAIGYQAGFVRVRAFRLK